ncbi:hypothetical protein EMCRGX_G015904 [Ephydatia muelleri]
MSSEPSAVPRIKSIDENTLQRMRRKTLVAKPTTKGTGGENGTSTGILPPPWQHVLSLLWKGIWPVEADVGADT